VTLESNPQCEVIVVAFTVAFPVIELVFGMSYIVAPDNPAEASPGN
jgi:hypothetical protein